MAEQQGSDLDACLDHGQVFELQAMISPLVAGVILKMSGDAPEILPQRCLQSCFVPICRDFRLPGPL